MKKITDFARYIRNQERAQRRSEGERERMNRPHGRAGNRASRHVLKPRHGRSAKISPPANFSLINNPEATIAFFGVLDAECRRSESIFINLEDVTSLTTDALILILRRLQGPYKKCKEIGGNTPKDPKVLALFSQSGFYSHITHKPSNYDAQNDRGILRKREGKRVRENFCADLVHYTTEKLYGSVRKNGGLYRSLIECMANTRDHASRNPQNTEKWWVSCTYDQKENIVHFAFLDVGVGVFKSLRMRGFLRSLGQFLGILTYPDLLKDLLEGQLGSRTGKPYRGKGFPAIRRAEKRGHLKNLKIITNTAYLDSTAGIGRVLTREFRGTCITWEVHRE